MGTKYGHKILYFYTEAAHIRQQFPNMGTVAQNFPAAATK